MCKKKILRLIICYTRTPGKLTQTVFFYPKVKRTKPLLHLLDIKSKKNSLKKKSSKKKYKELKTDELIILKSWKIFPLQTENF